MARKPLRPSQICRAKPSTERDKSCVEITVWQASMYRELVLLWSLSTLCNPSGIITSPFAVKVREHSPIAFVFMATFDVPQLHLKRALKPLGYSHLGKKVHPTRQTYSSGVNNSYPLAICTNDTYFPNLSLILQCIFSNNNRNLREFAVLRDHKVGLSSKPEVLKKLKYVEKG